MSESAQLSESQSRALLEILSHSELYDEIQAFRYPDALDDYGPPFSVPHGQPSSSPSLQAMVTTLFTTLPGLRNVSQEFWNHQLGTLIRDLAKAELSESYDKGNLGIRKTLATALSALLEYVVRGLFAGFNRPDADLEAKAYDTNNADDLQRAFRDCMQRAVYGDLVTDIFKKTAETDRLSDHSPLVQAGHEFGLVNLASFLHFTLIKSPRGQQLLALIDNANRLVPWKIVRQTLKIGNVATMINAMVKVVLAKLSVTSVTNWVGLTQGQDQGTNLLQSIITQVLNWDIRDFKSRASKIEKSKDSPSKDQLSALRNYLQKPRETKEKLQKTSMEESKSIAHVILQDAASSTELTDSAHRQALDYLSIQLSIRDRQEIIRVLCHSTPDHLTQSVRDLVAAYEPMIRSVHNSVDLSDTVYDFEVFLRDLIRLSKLPEPSSRNNRRSSSDQPSVGDFVALFRKHQSSLHKFLHQVAKNGKDVTEWFHGYGLDAAEHFRQHERPADGQPNPGAGDLTPGLQSLFSELPEPKQKDLLPILDHYSKYLAKLHEASAVRLRIVVSSPQTEHAPLGTPGSSLPSSRTASPAPRLFSRTPKEPPSDATTAATAAAPRPAAPRIQPGPGAYLARWQALLDGTIMTPLAAKGGRVRGTGGPRGPPRATAEEGGVPGGDADSDDDVFADAYERLDQFALDDGDKVDMPDVRPVVEALGAPFKGLLARRGCTW